MSEFYEYGYASGRGGNGKHTNPAKDPQKKAEWDRGWEDGSKDKKELSSKSTKQEFIKHGSSYSNGVAKAEQEIMNKANSVGVKLKNASVDKESYHRGYVDGNKAKATKKGSESSYLMGFEDGKDDYENMENNWKGAFDNRMGTGW